MSETLSDQLYKSVVSNLGSDEHLQIAGLVSSATKYVLDRGSANNLRDLLDADPWQFEKNLDLVERPVTETWYEWPIATRTGHGGAEKALTGCLVAPHPAYDDLALVVTAWTNGGLARHAFAVALFNTNTLRLTAEKARKALRRDREQSYSRILQTIGTTISPGFRDEVEILSEGHPEALPGAFRDATAEVPFLMATLIATKCIGGLSVKAESGAELTLPSTQKREAKGLLKRLTQPNGRDIIDRTGQMPKWNTDI